MKFEFTGRDFAYFLLSVFLFLGGLVGLALFSDNGNGDRPKSKELVVVSPGADSPAERMDGHKR